MSQLNEIEQTVSGKTTTTAEATTVGDGLDGTVSEEAEGLNLTLAVRGFTHRYAAFTSTMSDLVNERRVSAQYAEYLMECSHELMWDYLHRRLAPCTQLHAGARMTWRRRRRLQSWLGTCTICGACEQRASRQQSP